MHSLHFISFFMYDSDCYFAETTNSTESDQPQSLSTTPNPGPTYVNTTGNPSLSSVASETVKETEPHSDQTAKDSEESSGDTATLTNLDAKTTPGLTTKNLDGDSETVAQTVLPTSYAANGTAVENATATQAITSKTQAEVSTHAPVPHSFPRDDDTDSVTSSESPAATTSVHDDVATMRQTSGTYVMTTGVSQEVGPSTVPSMNEATSASLDGVELSMTDSMTTEEVNHLEGSSTPETTSEESDLSTSVVMTTETTPEKIDLPTSVVMTTETAFEESDLSTSVLMTTETTSEEGDLSTSFVMTTETTYEESDLSISVVLTTEVEKVSTGESSTSMPSEMNISSTMALDDLTYSTRNSSTEEHSTTLFEDEVSSTIVLSSQQETSLPDLTTVTDITTVTSAPRMNSSDQSSQTMTVDVITSDVPTVTNASLMETTTQEAVSEDSQTSEDRHRAPTTAASEPSTKPELISLTYDITFDGDCKELVGNPALQEEFKTNLINALRYLLGLTISNGLDAFDIRCGSIVITVAFSNVTDRDKLDSAFKDLVKNGTLVVTVNNGTMSFPASQISEGPTTPPATTPRTDPTKKSDELTNVEMVLIIVFGVIGCSIVLLAFLACIVACHKRRMSQSFKLGHTPKMDATGDDFTLTKMDCPRAVYEDDRNGSRGGPKTNAAIGQFHYPNGRQDMYAYQSTPLNGDPHEADTLPLPSRHTPSSSARNSKGYDNPSFSSDELLDSRQHDSADDGLREVASNSHGAKGNEPGEGATAF